MKVRLFAACLLSALLLTSTAWGEDMANPVYEAWKAFPAGAWAKMKMVTRVGEQEKTYQIKSTLQMVTAEKIVLKVEVAAVIDGKVQPPHSEQQEHPARTTRPSEPEGTRTEETEVTLVVPAGTYECLRRTVTVSYGDRERVTVFWQCSDVPGGRVKMTREAGSARTVAELVELHIPVSSEEEASSEPG
jgi:hypothetical protein